MVSRLPEHAQEGGRVLVLQDRATVRYLGSVAGQDGLWVGLEWDDPSRGKHDGCTGGVRYFETKGGPTAGSFVRAEKVKFGCSVVEALKARYSNERGELGEVKDEELYVHTARRRKVQIHVVGVEKIQQQQSQTHRLHSARLVGMGISHAGDAQELQQACGNLCELDLTSNLVGDFMSFVGPLTQACTRLQALNLSDNQVVLPPPSAAPSAMSTLRALVLNDCRITWQQVIVLDKLLPGLQELHLCGNSITSLQWEQGEGSSDTAQSGQSFKQLQVLSLEDNKIAQWEEVMQLAWLASLTSLSLSDNPLSSIHYPASTQGAASASGTTASEQQQPVAFAALQKLYLASCQLSSWSDVDALHHFPALRELRLTGNPILATAKGGGRYEIVGRVAGLVHLNGADIRPRERRDAELRYLQTVLGEMFNAPAGEERAAIGSKHPRLKELMGRYGEVLASAAPGAQGNPISSSLVSLKLTCVAAAAGAKMGSSDKKLPRSTTLGAVRLLCEKLFKVKAGQQALYLRAPGDPLPEDITCEEDSRTLGELGVQDAWEVLVDELDVEAQAQQQQLEKAQQAAAHEEKLQQQGQAGDKLQAEMVRTMRAVAL